MKQNGFMYLCFAQIGVDSVLWPHC